MYSLSLFSLQSLNIMGNTATFISSGQGSKYTEFKEFPI